jgi:hypothetical protein
MYRFNKMKVLSACECEEKATHRQLNNRNILANELFLVYMHSEYMTVNTLTDIQ